LIDNQEGWLSPVEGTRLEIERGSDVTVGSNPTPSATPSKVKRGVGEQKPFLGQAQYMHNNA
jgi:hypothetical protein